MNENKFNQSDTKFDKKSSIPLVETWSSIEIIFINKEQDLLNSYNLLIRDDLLILASVAIVGLSMQD